MPSLKNYGPQHLIKFRGHSSHFTERGCERMNGPVLVPATLKKLRLNRSMKTYKTVWNQKMSFSSYGTGMQKEEVRKLLE